MLLELTSLLIAEKLAENQVTDSKLDRWRKILQ